MTDPNQIVATREPQVVRSGPSKVLAVTSKGDPESKEFQDAISALFALAWTIKMTRKQHGSGGDFKVPALEAIWWAGRSGKDFAKIPRSQWHWKLFMRMPGSLTAVEVQDAKRALAAKGHASAKKVKKEVLDEGLCVEMLHVGPYATEGRTIERMEEFAREHGLSFRGRHHEIYLSDPRRTAPERLRTGLLHPVRPG